MGGGGLRTHNVVKPTSTWLWLSWGLTIFIILNYFTNSNIVKSTRIIGSAIVVGGLNTHNVVKPTSTWLWLSWVLTATMSAQA